MTTTRPSTLALRLGEALRLIRRRRNSTMTAAARLEGAPDLRTLKAWESGRELPAMEPLEGYLAALGAGLGELHEALEKVEGRRHAEESAASPPRPTRIDVS